YFNDDIKIAVGFFFHDNLYSLLMELLKLLALYLKQDKTQQYFQQAVNCDDLYNLFINTSN
ncbi:PTS sugar transporter subunit IIA, partial [Francisella tularensis subsp. holarctica]|nr:PTS sugar transporter subunit IIA [Francisella tularensis subsp. holarctica]